MKATSTHEESVEQLQRFVADTRLDRRLAPLRGCEAVMYLAVLITAANHFRVAAVAASLIVAAVTVTARGYVPRGEPIPVALAVAKAAAIAATGFGTDGIARFGATWGLISSLVVLAFATLSVLVTRMLGTRVSAES